MILPPGYSSWGAHNRPQPNPEVEAKVRETLLLYDELLDIHWFEGIHYNERYKDHEGRYALVCRWPLGDKRYLMVQTGEIGDFPYDILGWFTEDMQDGGTAAMPPEMIWTRVDELLASADNNRMPWLQRMQQVAQKNKDHKLKIRHDYVENEVHDSASYYRNAALGIQQVNVPVEIDANGKIRPVV